jgi:hypothetical protein
VHTRWIDVFPSGFTLAFWMFAANWTAVSLLRPMDAPRYLYFVPRLIRFVLILIAIVDEDRDRSTHG